MTETELREDIKTQISDPTLDGRVDSWFATHKSQYPDNLELVSAKTLLKVLELRRGKLQNLIDTRRDQDETKASQVLRNVNEQIKDAQSLIAQLDPETTTSVTRMKTSRPVSIHDGATSQSRKCYGVK